MNLKWLGKQVEARVTAACVIAIDEVMALCVNGAKQNHPWKNVTGTAEGSIRLTPAVVEGSMVVGRWGSYDVVYFIFLETGTSRMSAMPCLRPAADLYYHELPRRMVSHIR